MTFAYTVRAEFADARHRAAYLDWLVGGHAADVVAAGATSAQVVTLDDGAVEARYLFPSAQAFRDYEAGPAVALRAESAEKFGSADVRFHRSTGALVVAVPA